MQDSLLKLVRLSRIEAELLAGLAIDQIDALWMFEQLKSTDSPQSEPQEQFSDYLRALGSLLLQEPSQEVTTFRTVTYSDQGDPAKAAQLANKLLGRLS